MVWAIFENSGIRGKFLVFSAGKSDIPVHIPPLDAGGRPFPLDVARDLLVAGLFRDSSVVGRKFKTRWSGMTAPCAGAL